VKLLAVSHTGLHSGAEAVLLRTAVAARDTGWEVVVATPAGEFDARATRATFAVVRLPELKMQGGSRAAAAAGLAFRAMAAARVLRAAAADADLVLANGLLALPSIRFSRTRAPVAWLVHDVLHQRKQLLTLRLGGSAVALAIAVSEATAEPLRRAHVPTVVVRNGTAWPPPHPPMSPEQPPVVGSAALLVAWKGQDVLLEAMARIDRPDVVLELAGGFFPGDEAYVAALRQRAEEPGLRGRVRFLGHVDDVLERVRHWTVAVSASVEPEAAPLAVLEAMSVGVPVVGTAHGGTMEVLGDAGLLVTPGDPGELAAAIGRLLDDPGFRARCSAAGTAAIAAGLTLDRWATEIIETMESVAATRHSRP
jgi:glycosyltransferase involved in cell wall biosynthesis